MTWNEVQDNLDNIVLDIPQQSFFCLLKYMDLPVSIALYFQKPSRGTFSMKDITPDQCSGLTTPNCRISKETKTCRRGSGLFAECDASAENQEVREFLSKIAQLNAGRGLKFTVKGPRAFPNDAYAQVADILIIIIVADFDDFDLSMLRSLELPILTHIGITNSRNVVIGKDDFLPFPSLTMFVLTKSTVAKLDQGALESLAHLQQALFDTGIPIDKSMTLEQRDHLKLLHCDCEHAWLRKWLKAKPQLIAAKSPGEVHSFGGILSNGFFIRQIYAPIDCASTNLIGEITQVPFSINDTCPPGADGGSDAHEEGPVSES